MKDKRAEKLAKLLLEYSLNVRKGEKILIDGLTINEEFIDELTKQLLLKEAFPITNIKSQNSEILLLKHGNKEQISFFPEHILTAIDQTDAVIDFEFGYNSKELSSIDPKKISQRALATKPFWNKLLFDNEGYRRVTVLIPTKFFADDANLPLREYENLVYSACFIDWSKLTEKFQKINKIFNKGGEVHLLGENVNLKFSIKGRNSILENGKENMPGGEIYMAPIKTSLNGWIKFEFPSFLDGIEVRDIFLRFKKGRVVEENASHGLTHLKSVLNTDHCSRYVGEFGIGIHPTLKKVTNSWLDEKIDGTIHLALGKSYDENQGDNDSAIHWDIVKDMSKAKIILDGKVIQEDGKWKI